MKIPPLIKAYVFIILASLCIYLAINQDKSLDDVAAVPASPVENITTSPLITPDSEIVDLIGAAIPNSEVIIEPKRNDSIMNSSMQTIEDIFNSLCDLDNCTIDDCNKYISMIRTVPLSKEYDEMKELLIEKIGYMINYIQYEEPEYLDMYNSIDLLECEKQAFDKAKVRNEYQEDGALRYWYYTATH